MTTTRDKFATTMKEMSAGLIERDAEIALVLTGLLAKEHVLLVGAPGCAKSMLLDSLLKWTGGNKFTWLLNKYSVPEELFGPVSVAGLKADVYKRITTGKLPESDFAFLDEIFKASSAILNTLLKILNERTFDAGDGINRKCPLKLCVAASNEWPNPETGKELGALFDRLVLRKSVRTIGTTAGRKRLWWDRTVTSGPDISTRLEPVELEKAAFEAASLTWSKAGMDAFETIMSDLRKEGVTPGDRRQVKAVKVAAAYAWLHGAESVQPDHLEVLDAVLWDDPQEQPAICSRVISKVANPVGMRVSGCLLEAEDILEKCDVRRLDSAAKAAAQLSEIHAKLKAMPGDGRVTKALRYVEEQSKSLRIRSVESI